MDKDRRLAPSRSQIVNSIKKMVTDNRHSEPSVLMELVDVLLEYSKKDGEELLSYLRRTQLQAKPAPPKTNGPKGTIYADSQSVHNSSITGTIKQVAKYLCTKFRPEIRLGEENALKDSIRLKLESNKIINIVNKYPFISKIYNFKDGGCNLSRQKIYKLLKLDETPIPIAHSPKIFKKSLVEIFSNKFSKQINDQKHRKFRSIDDFCFIAAFCFYFEKNKLLEYRHDYETKILCQFDNIIISKIMNNIIDDIKKIKPFPKFFLTTLILLIFLILIFLSV
jgi:hypothetical protein